LNRFRSFIISFCTCLISVGLLISTIHVHELADGNHSAHDIYTIHEINQDHNQCPMCAVVFEADSVEKFIISIHIPLIDLVTELSEQVSSSLISLSSDQRAPPLFSWFTSSSYPGMHSICDVKTWSASIMQKTIVQYL